MKNLHKLSLDYSKYCLKKDSIQRMSRDYLHFYLLFTLGFSVLVMSQIISPVELYLCWIYTYCTALDFLNYPLNTSLKFMIDAELINMPYQSWLQMPLIISTFKKVCWMFLALFLLASILFKVLVTLLVHRREERRIDMQPTRNVQPPEKVASYLPQPSSFLIDGVVILPDQFEKQHVLISGTTGTGKSVLIRKLLLWIRAQGGKAMIYDKGGLLAAEFFDPTTDKLLNPYDKRSVLWQLWLDAKKKTEFEQVAEMLFPTKVGQADNFWYTAARAVFTAVCIKLQDQGRCSTNELCYWLLESDYSALCLFLKETPGNIYITQENLKMAVSIRSTLSNATRHFEIFKDREAEAAAAPERTFSIRDWIRDETSPGFLFLTSGHDQHAVLKSFVTLWFTIASNTMLGLKADPNRRVWFIMDEFPSLHPMHELSTHMAEMRKFGGCYVAGIQSYAQLQSCYGHDEAAVVFDLFNTCFQFRAPSYDLALQSARNFGDDFTFHLGAGRTMQAGKARHSESIQQQQQCEALVRTNHVLLLKNLNCWVRTIGDLPAVKLVLKYESLPQRYEPFVQFEYREANVPKQPKFDTSLS